MNDTNIIIRQKRNENSFIEASAFSIIGHREYQQDFAGLVIENKTALAVVCDGMGGLNGGEQASREAVQLLLEDYDREKPGQQFTEFLCREAVRMDQLVCGLTNSQGQLLKAGSTTVSVIVHDGKLYWMSVGDSRIYVLRGTSIVSVTRDHNYRRELEDMMARGEITRERFRAEASTRKADALTSYLGMGGLRRIERNMKPFPLEEGDMILLCSDGLYKSLDEHQIQAMILDNQISLTVAVRRLVRMAKELAVKSQDNTTAVLLRYDGVSEEEKI